MFVFILVFYVRVLIGPFYNFAFTLINEKYDDCL